jgi:hypothetical protein
MQTNPGRFNDQGSISSADVASSIGSREVR